MQDKKTICIALLFFRIILPGALLLSIALRPFGVSIFYLLLYLILPLVRTPDGRSIKGLPGKTILITLIVSSILLTIHAVFHIALASYPPYGSLVHHQHVQAIMAILGFVPYTGIDPLKAVHWLAPDAIMTLVSIIVFFTLKKFLTPSEQKESHARHKKEYQEFPFLTKAGSHLSVLFIMLSSAMFPSVTSAVYFLAFVAVCTVWALGKSLDKWYSVFCRFLMVLMAFHVLATMIYQNIFVTELLPPESLYARLSGLKKLVTINTTGNYFNYDVEEWPIYASPLVILVTYYILGLVSKELLKTKRDYKKKGGLVKLDAARLNGSLGRTLTFKRLQSRSSLSKDRWMHASRKARDTCLTLRRNESSPPDEKTPLMGTVQAKRSYTKKPSVPVRQSTSERSARYSVPSECVIEPETNVTGEDITEEVEEEGDLDDRMVLWDEILLAIIDFAHVLIRSSYIATSIAMMAWSIMYHSWATFVLLVWANIVWLHPNQRAAMLRWSPLLVVYATFLLSAQYILGIDLTDEELPTSIDGYSLKSIGFSRPEVPACYPIVIKSLFCVMFWLTLRQRTHEASRRRTSSALADLAAPLHLSVRTAAPVLTDDDVMESRLLANFGKHLWMFCTKFWIYMVAITLFVIGITGNRMTIFRIIYMFMFLAFTLMFQISVRLWRKFLYPFWILLIIYSMANLVLIYIYQFDGFPETIADKLLIPLTLQNDLGLEQFKTADLFVKLLTPTLFLIITIIQLHYFHKDFMEMSKLKSRHSSLTAAEQPRPRTQSGVSTIKDDVANLSLDSEAVEELKSQVYSVQASNRPSNRSSIYRKASFRDVQSTAPTITEQSETFKSHFYNWFERGKIIWDKWIDLLFLYLEMNLKKLVLLAFMFLCIFQVYAIHVPILILICPALLLTSKQQHHCILFCTILVALYMMALMVYQIDHIKHGDYDNNCTETLSLYGTTNYVVYNNAEWVGFFKVSAERPLTSLVAGYISIIAVTTLYSVVRYRQSRERSFSSEASAKIKVMFPPVTRKEADKDLIHCIKFLFNYGFYKFGVEVTLIWLVGVVGSRMDALALAYAVWLAILATRNRKAVASLWPLFTGYVTTILPLQYIIAVGLLPYFCVTYPWTEPPDKNEYGSYRHFFFLPDPHQKPHASKLIFDYFLLLFCARQRKVFIKERKYGPEYPGGYNGEDIGQHYETPAWVNPVPDFLNNVSSWLDIVKRAVLLGMLWLSLAIMFLTGTNRVNLFSIGYLMGSFVFLWQGTDFYLRPKASILKWWSCLLKYNIIVIVLKAILQIPGCLYNSYMLNNYCWIVQLLSIGCVNKFVGGSLKKFLRQETADSPSDANCTVPYDDIGLAWDGVCFACLLLQRRLFHSYYFYRIIDDSKAITVLASRGAELIEEMRQKQMKQQEENEKKILEKIKTKMERIKATQKKLHASSEKEHHHADGDASDGTSKAPLDSSERGYRTPEDDDAQSVASPKGFRTPEHTPPESPKRKKIPPPIIIPQTNVAGGPPSPSSALMTQSLDGYLEPRRISFGSVESSILEEVSAGDDTEPVFSPSIRQRRYTLPASIASATVGSPPSASHHTCLTAGPRNRKKAIRSGDYYMFDEFDEIDVGKDEKRLERTDSDLDVPKQLGVGQLLSDAMRTNFSRALLKRRASAPALRAHGAGPTHIGSVASDTFLPLRLRHPQRVDPTQEQLAESEIVHMELSDPAARQDSLIFEAEAVPEQTKFEKAKSVLMFIKAFMESIVVSLVRLLKKYSSDYRYVSRTLAAEKKLLKESEGFGMGIREGAQKIWQPLPTTVITKPQELSGSTKTSTSEDLTDNQFGRKLSDISVPEIRILAASMEGGLDDRIASTRALDRSISEKNVEDSKMQEDEQEQPKEDSVELQAYEDNLEVESPKTLRTSQRHYSIYSARFTESDDEHTIEERDSLFTKNRSLIVHLGLAFWYAILAHTDIVCYLMVFVNQIQSATLLSLPLPLLVFLWGTLTIPRPTKTFWVTLIAYTEVIVLIKSMSQFDLLPWNTKLVYERDFFTPASIIGVERKHNYALYDLLLLLLIFFHRYMLKSLGLWKTTSSEPELKMDTSYKLNENESKEIHEGNAEDLAKRIVEKHNKNARPRRLSKFNVENETGRQLDGEEPGTSQRDDDFIEDDAERLILDVETEVEKPYKHYPHAIKEAFKRYTLPIRNFFKRMLDRTARVTADVYAYMFMCDFFNFLVVIFGFAAFGTHQGDGGVTAYLQENKVPIPFLVMLIVQFALIVIDRALYLRKYILGKILFQYALIIGIHVWMFFVLPLITERKFNSLIPPPLWYMMKCIYLLLSAHQIRCGYPARILGNCLTKGYSYVNMYLFKAFMAIPFVFELRTMMDWMWTDTSMTLTDWLKMEDIFANIFLLKCARNVEDKYPQPRGEKKSPVTKYLLGGIGLAVVISIIWFPLVFFAFGNRVGAANPPSDVTVKIRIGPYLPAYVRSAQNNHIIPYSYSNFDSLINLYEHDKTVQTFLANYQFDDVAVVDLVTYSTSVWEISPPELESLQNEISGNASIGINFVYVITHLTNSKDNPPTIEESRSITMNVQNLTALGNFLKNTSMSHSDWIPMPTLFPKFVKVFNLGTAGAANQFIKPKQDSENPADESMFRGVSMQLMRKNSTLYWQAQEICDDSADATLLKIPLNTCTGSMRMFTFNDKRFPATLNFISGGGIIGLYTTFVLLASRVLRGFFSGIYSNIMFEDLPYVDRVLQLCLDIYLVREALELALEEDLFAKLVFLYRSPETMIKWTRDKEQSPDISARPLPRPQQVDS